MPLKRPLSLAMAVLVLAGGTLAASAPADAAGYRTAGAIGSLYKARAATLGAPTSNEHAGHGDRVQTFRNGLVIWSAKTGAHSVSGGILGEYKARGGDGGSLGLPVSEEIKTRGGVVQRFTGGTIYWAPGAGSHSVNGGIASLYAQLGGEKSILGYPTSGETVVKTNVWTPVSPTLSQPTTIVTQNFQNGMITWNGTRSALNTDPAHAHFIFGAIYKEYMATGGPFAHGNAVFDVKQANSAIGQNFLDGGAILSDPKLGTHFIQGDIYNAWVKNGGVTGPLGLPKTDAYQVIGWPTSQDFQGGRIYLPPTCSRILADCIGVQFGTNLPPELPNLLPAPAPVPSTPAPLPLPTDPASPAPVVTPAPAPTDTATPAPTDTATPVPTDTPTDTATPVPTDTTTTTPAP